MILMGYSNIKIFSSLDIDNTMNNVGNTMPPTSHDWEWFITPIKIMIWGMVLIMFCQHYMYTYHMIYIYIIYMYNNTHSDNNR